jgi:hypothetical protein
LSEFSFCALLLGAGRVGCLLRLIQLSHLGLALFAQARDLFLQFAQLSVGSFERRLGLVTLFGLLLGARDGSCRGLLARLQALLGPRDALEVERGLGS